MKKIILCICMISVVIGTLNAFSSKRNLPKQLQVLIKAYPDVNFEVEYDPLIKDWKINIVIENRTACLYWAEGKMLPLDKYLDKDKYWTLIYQYNNKLKSPSTFTKEEIERIRAFSSPENRKKGAGTPPFFYDVVYDCKSQQEIEAHIVTVKFLDFSFRVHKRIQEPLKRVEQKIQNLAKDDTAVKMFISELSQIDSYYWRTIRDSTRRSFHSLGIAVDILPKNYRNRIIYWAWQRDISPNEWMLTPLEKRWIPPQSVIRIFEEEGFIWGGYWAIWDNMHFEYHPEITINQKL